MADREDRKAQAADPAGRPAPARPDGCGYVISIRGQLGEHLRAAFSPLRVTTCPGHTLLQGVLEDQAALYGVLARIQAHGLELEEVRLLPGQGPLVPGRPAAVLPKLHLGEDPHGPG